MRAMRLKIAIFFLPIVVSSVLVAMPASAAETSDASAKLVKCHRGASATARYALFSAEMNGVASDQMAVQLKLLKRSSGETAYSEVDFPGLGQWEGAESGVTDYKVKKRVTNLDAPASYKAQITFRWTDVNGQVTTATKLTSACNQLDTRPDLVAVGAPSIASLSATATRRRDAQSVYRVVVRNAGRALATNFDVSLTIDGVTQPSVTISRLRARGKRVVKIFGGTCAAGSSLVFSIDPDNRVAESNETNNSVTTTCSQSPTGRL